jgi:hypothetical protein
LALPFRSNRALVGSRFEGYGLKRIIRDLLQLPGKLTFEEGKIAKSEVAKYSVMVPGFICA